MADRQQGYPMDDQFERIEIKSVTRENHGYGVERVDGWYLYLDDVGIEPEPGDMMRCYGLGIGHPVRGIIIEGKGTVRYRTEAEEEAEWQRRAEERDREKRADLDEHRAERDLAVRELPRPLRERIEGFQRAREDWRRDFEPYELFVCQEAAKVAEHFEGENAVYRLNEWAELSYDEQRASWDGMSDEHSGNTFGQALALARMLLLHEDAEVQQMHGALCPLVGCEEYGCVPAREPSRA